MPIPADDIRNITTSNIQPPYNRHTAATVSKHQYVMTGTYVCQFCHISANGRVKPAQISKYPEVAADFKFYHKSSDQDCLKIPANDTDGFVTSRTAVPRYVHCKQFPV